MQPGLCFLLLATLVAVATLALGDGPSPYLAEAQDSRHQFSGLVVDENGSPVEGLLVAALAAQGGDGLTGAGGAFRLRLVDGTYRLYIWSDAYDRCTVSGIENPEGRAEAVFTMEGEDVTSIRIVVASSDRTQSARWVQCHFDVPSYRVAGVVTDAQGNPLANTSLNFTGDGQFQTTTDDAGMFRLHLQEGSYRLGIWTDLGTDCRIEGYEGAAPGRGNSILVDGGGVGDLRLVLLGEAQSTITAVKCPYPETIATELEPGWNLAGWTGPATAVSAVFDATPQLEIIYAWSVETQSFLGAIRQESGGPNSLKTLEPGMGLWLFIEGTERVNWRRPFLIESALVSLADGWNLVSWGGRDGATADDIFNSLGAGPVVAAAWDASQGAFLRASTAAPAGARTELQVRRGDALWLQTSERERWLQPGWPAPDVVLAGDPHNYDDDGYLQLVREAQAFYADRYGAITSEVTFYFVADREALEDTYSLVRGHSPSANLCADSSSEVIFIATYTYQCFPIAHEYFHSIQQALSGSNYLGSPTWIVEGSAFYTDYERRYSEGQASILSNLHFFWATLGPEVTLETESSYRTKSILGQIAFEWHAEEVGEEAIIDYFALLKRSDTWEEAFQRAFGLTPDDFYARFEEHRREVAPPFEWVVTGTVLDRDAQPVEGIKVGVFAYVEGLPATNMLTPTAPDGSFAIEHAPGSGYVLLMVYNCPDGAHHDIGGYGQDGFTTDGRNAPPFTGEDLDRRGLTIRLPATLAELERDNCAP